MFTEWNELAKQQKLMMASMKGDDGKIYVFLPNGIRLPFDMMLAKYPGKNSRHRCEKRKRRKTLAPSALRAS